MEPMVGIEQDSPANEEKFSDNRSEIKPVLELLERHSPTLSLLLLTVLLTVGN